MSMEVDLSTPLTKEEAEYLAMRGRYAELERAAHLTGEPVPELDAGDGTGPKVMPLGTAEQRAGERERLLARLAELDAADEGSVEGDEPEPYEVWTPQELKDEIDRRNEGRPDEAKLSKGTKAQMAERLYADDEAAARTQQP